MISLVLLVILSFLVLHMYFYNGYKNSKGEQEYIFDNNEDFYWNFVLFLLLFLVLWLPIFSWYLWSKNDVKLMNDNIIANIIPIDEGIQKIVNDNSMISSSLKIKELKKIAESWKESKYIDKDILFILENNNISNSNKLDMIKNRLDIIEKEINKKNKTLENKEQDNVLENISEESVETYKEFNEEGESLNKEIENMNKEIESLEKVTNQESKHEIQVIWDNNSISSQTWYKNINIQDSQNINVEVE